MFGTDNANITYVPVERPDPSINYDYKDGTYYGRDANKKVAILTETSMPQLPDLGGLTGQ